MRLPSGILHDIDAAFIGGQDFTIIGCLSFEERCCALPERLFGDRCKAIELLVIEDPIDAFPNYSFEAARKINEHKERLIKSRITFESIDAKLLATEDQLLDIIDHCSNSAKHVPVIVLDITSLPKRFFCFFLKRMLLRSEFKNLIVTYTAAGKNGYTQEHLTDDPMTCDHLPGFGGPLPPKGDTLVVSVGFESLNLRSLLEIYSDRKRATKVIVSFPPDGETLRRQWISLKQMVEVPQEIKGCLQFVAAWDAEEVYKTLERWGQDSDGLALAPFGTKSHSLGLALYAVKNDAGLYYAQPKSYNPNYSMGEGDTWAYVVKWAGIPCYERFCTQA